MTNEEKEVVLTTGKKVNIKLLKFKETATIADIEKKSGQAIGVLEMSITGDNKNEILDNLTSIEGTELLNAINKFNGWDKAFLSKE